MLKIKKTPLITMLKETITTEKKSNTPAIMTSVKNMDHRETPNVRLDEGK
jgi:hypothetical protein